MIHTVNNHKISNTSCLLERPRQTEQTQIRLLLKKLSGHGLPCSGLFPAILGKAPGQNWEKIIDLTSNLGEINNIEHNKDSKIYPQNQGILDCIMSSIPLMHK